MGLEPTPGEYVAGMVEVFSEVRRVLREDGTLWLNLGDSYSADWNSKRAKGGGGFKDESEAPRTRITRTPGYAPKQLIGIPWRVAFALQDAGWYLRSDIIWHKPNPMPESVTDRPTKAHEYLFLLAKSERYYYDAEAIQEPVADSQIGRVRADVIGGSSWKGRQQHSKGGVYATTPTRGILPELFNVGSGGSVRVPQVGGAVRPASEGAEPQESDMLDGRGSSAAWPSNARNKRSVWTVNTEPYPEAHFATYPPDLIRPCILAGCPVDGVVLDPFAGSGTTLAVARQMARRAIGIELNPEYCALVEKRFQQGMLW